MLDKVMQAVCGTLLRHGQRLRQGCDMPRSTLSNGFLGCFLLEWFGNGHNYVWHYEPRHLCSSPWGCSGGKSVPRRFVFMVSSVCVSELLSTQLVNSHITTNNKAQMMLGAGGCGGAGRVAIVAHARPADRPSSPRERH